VELAARTVIKPDLAILHHRPEETEQLQVAAPVEVVVVILHADQTTAEEMAVLAVLVALLDQPVKRLDL
jgi:mannitol/fructose-specific phosphotransferase system IIA component (Ntr-type)